MHAKTEVYYIYTISQVSIIKEQDCKVFSLKGILNMDTIKPKPI